jgi:hypothetical protein
MGTVTIGSDTFDIYGTTAGANSYLNGSFQFAATWAALSPDQKSRALVEACRMIDRQTYAGEPTTPGQAHAFPRTGLTYPDGTAVSSSVVPIEVEDAEYLLAAIIAGNAALATTNPAQAGNVKRVDAKGTSVEFFLPLVDDAGRFPLPVQELIGQWMAGSAAIAELGGGQALGTAKSECMSDAISRETWFDDTYVYREQ